MRTVSDRTVYISTDSHAAVYTARVISSFIALELFQQFHAFQATGMRRAGARSVARWSIVSI